MKLALKREIPSYDEPAVERTDVRPQSPGPLTLEEHRELGAEMRAMNAQMQELCKVVVSVYGPHNQAAFTFQKVADGMDRLCQDLQSQASKDLPGYPVDGFYLLK